MGVCTNERWEINLHLRATTASLNERQNAEITLTHGASGRVSARGGHSNSRPIHPSPGEKIAARSVKRTNSTNDAISLLSSMFTQMNHCDMDGFGMKMTGLIVTSITDRPRPTCSIRRTYPCILSYASLCVLCQSVRHAMTKREDDTSAESAKKGTAAARARGRTDESYVTRNNTLAPFFCHCPFCLWAFKSCPKTRHVGISCLTHE